METRHIRQELIRVVDGLGSDLASRARSGQRKHVRLSSTYTVQENSTNTKESVSAKVVLIAVQVFSDLFLKLTGESKMLSFRCKGLTVAAKKVTCVALVLVAPSLEAHLPDQTLPELEADMLIGRWLTSCQRRHQVLRSSERELRAFDQPDQVLPGKVAPTCRIVNHRVLCFTLSDLDMLFDCRSDFLQELLP